MVYFLGQKIEEYRQAEMKYNLWLVAADSKTFKKASKRQGWNKGIYFVSSYDSLLSLRGAFHIYSYLLTTCSGLCKIIPL